MDDDEEPGCPDPDLHGKDYHGNRKNALDTLSVQYDYSKFETMEGNGARLLTGEIKASKVILKAPIHTCRIKTAPGLREWINTMVKNNGIYSSHVQVQPFSQPPNFNFYDADENIIERVKVDDEVTVTDIRAFLRSRGVFAEGELVKNQPAAAINVYEEEEVDTDVLEARKEIADQKLRLQQQQQYKQQQDQRFVNNQHTINNDDSVYEEVDISVSGIPTIIKNPSSISSNTNNDDSIGIDL